MTLVACLEREIEALDSMLWLTPALSQQLNAMRALLALLTQ